MTARVTLPLAPYSRPSPADARATPAHGYAEYPAPNALRPYVECLWSRADAPSGPSAHRILPDGCIDIILGFGTELSTAYVVGTMTRPLIVRRNEQASFLGVRFRPGGAYAVLGVPASELTNLRVPVAELWRDGSDALEPIARSRDVAARRHALGHVLARRLASARAEPARDVDAAVRTIRASDGNLEIAALAATLGVTRQHLARRFADRVGVPPKTFARVVRMQRLLARLERVADDDVEWSALALEHGYYDQSHLVAEFKTLTGLTPRRWLLERHSTGPADSIFPRRAAPGSLTSQLIIPHQSTGALESA